MAAVFNGMPAGQVAGAIWRKSTYSGQLGNCVEVAELPTGEVAVRNSRDPEGPALIYSRDEIAAFVAGIKDGEFDLTITGDLATNPADVTAAHDTAVEPLQPSTTGQRLPATEFDTEIPRDRTVDSELHQLTDTLLTGETVLDRAATERMLRLLGAAVSLVGQHRIDDRGRCTACHRKALRWLPWVGRSGCNVHATFNRHFGRLVNAPAEQA